jgi:sugar lactone lactonase YvrE
MREAEKFTAALFNHGEGPFWDSRGHRLLCLDVLAGTVVAIDSMGAIRRYRVPSRAATAIRHRAGSGFVIGTAEGVVVADEALVEYSELVHLIDDPAVRTNDGTCDPLGGFVIGTMALSEEADRGAVYRVTGDREVDILLSPVTISNGVQYSADGRRAYYIDTPTRRVDMFDVDPASGAWSCRRTHFRIDTVTGFPDGMAIDEEDGLWIALWGGGAVNHYDYAGRLVETIRVPEVSQVSSCAFGGDGRRILFITTSRKGLAPKLEPTAGSVFMIETAVTGAALSEFAG